MNTIKVQIKNYRSIPLDSPITIELKEGIQFIVGVNNVGKSNLLRVFSDFRESFYRYSTPNYEKGHYKELKTPFDSLCNQESPHSPVELSITYKSLKEKVALDVEGDYRHSRGMYVYNSYSLRIDEPGSKERSEVEELVKSLTSIMYIGASRNSIHEAKGKSFDGDVGQSFFHIWNQWATGEEKIKMKKIALLTGELQQLFGYQRFEIKINADSTNMIITNDDGAFSLNELGTGIAHFVITLGNALFKQPSYILIDEPETGLHPKMQEMFVRALASKARYGLIATSHSIGLARSVADEILTLTKENGKPKLVPFGQHYRTTISQSVSEMGYSQYAELGGTNILLVEGRTEIKCFREILRKWGIDKNFIVISLGGGDFITDNNKVIDELNELKRLNAKSISVIFDSEITKKGSKLTAKFLGFKKICESLSFNVFPTEYYSTENYINQQAINTVLGDNYKQLTPYENFNKSKNKWSKDKNWLMFREMTKEDFNGTDLAAFIQNTLVPLADNTD
ncbi:MAG TPA: AAA family ATPase [Chitinophagales bacterium]|nr:AAA family ATPase [Chitinophagales bacterium]